MKDPKQSRGYRNRNPGNIDYVPANRWQGQVGLGDAWLPEDRRRFAEFISHEYGIRALASLLTTYQDRHGLRTVRGIIDRWAPPTENATSAYVMAVARAVGVGPDDVLDLHNFVTLRAMVVAIIHHELGGNPYDAATIDEGLRLFGVPRPVETMSDAAHTGTGRGVIAGAAVAGAAGVAAQAAPAISALQGLDWRVGVAVIAAAAIGVIVFVLSKRKG